MTTSPHVSATSTSRRSALLQRFVAYSILAHVGAMTIWGLPSWLVHQAERERAAEQQRLAEHLRTEAVKSKAHAREQRIAKTRHDVQEEMRKDLGKLVSGLSEKRREDVLQRVEAKTETQANRLAEALGNPETPEQNLRNLEAELQQAMIAQLDEQLSQSNAQALAEEFLVQVDTQVAPDLAAWMRSEVDKRVADKMKEETEKLLREEHDEAAKSLTPAEAAERDRQVTAAMRAAAPELRAQIEKRLSDDLVATTLPRLEKSFKEAFAKQLTEAGVSDAALASEVAKQASQHLATSVPALAKIGESVQARLDAAIPGATSAGNTPSLGPSKSDAALAAALAAATAAIGAHAVASVDAIASDARGDARLIAHVTGKGLAPAGEAAALADMHDRVAAVARSMKNGRMGAMGSGGGSGISGLRQGAVARAGHARDEAAYQAISGMIAGRESVQGTHWDRHGAEGEAAHAEAVAGRLQPARVVVASADKADTSTLTNAEPYKPSFKSIAFTSVPEVPGTFHVDGNIDKWQNIPAVSLTPEGGDDHSPQSMRVAWSSAGIFMLFTIVDPDHHLGKAEAGNFWQADVAEIWIDAYNTKESHRARHSGQQFWVWPQGSASNPDLTGGESVMLKDGSYTPTALRSDRLERWSTVTPTGWILEARIPAASIADADLAPGRILGFNTYVTTMTPTGWFWSAGKRVGTQAQPDTWGDLLLAGSDATLTVGDAKEPATAHALVGEPLPITVSDGDMNLDPTQRDKVMVTVKDAHGGQQIAVLEENAPDSGVFTGSVSTALALDEPLPGALGVYEGERVEVVYIDQARANGARDANVTAAITFASAVTTCLGEPIR